MTNTTNGIEARLAAAAPKCTNIQLARMLRDFTDLSAKAAVTRELTKRFRGKAWRPACANVECEDIASAECALCTRCRRG